MNIPNYNDLKWWDVKRKSTSASSLSPLITSRSFFLRRRFTKNSSWMSHPYKLTSLFRHNSIVIHREGPNTDVTTFLQVIIITMEEDDDNQVQGGLRVRIEVTYWIASHVQSSHHECEEEQGTTTAVTTESSRHYFDATNTSEVRVGLPIGAEPVKVRTCRQFLFSSQRILMSCRALFSASFSCGCNAVY